MMTALEAPDRTPKTYSRAEFSGLHAPLERVPPAVKLRRMLRSRFLLRSRHPEQSYLTAAGAHDAMTAAILTDLGFEAVHAAGEPLAAARGLYPDAGLSPSHLMAELVRELSRGVAGLRDRHFYDSGGAVKEAPPIFADVETRHGGPARTFALARELIRAGAAGLRVEDRDPAQPREWLESLIAAKAAAQAEESEAVLIASTASFESALEAAALGVDVICPELAGTELDEARRFAAGVHRRFPEQILGFNLSPALPWGEAKRRGLLPASRQLGALGCALQFSPMFAFRAAGMALENWLRGLRGRGLDALADLQLVEAGSLDAEPRTRLPRGFSGAERWLALDRTVRAAARRDRT